MNADESIPGRTAEQHEQALAAIAELAGLSDADVKRQRQLEIVCQHQSRLAEVVRVARVSLFRCRMVDEKLPPEVLHRDGPKSPEALGLRGGGPFVWDVDDLVMPGAWIMAATSGRCCTCKVEFAEVREALSDRRRRVVWHDCLPKG